MNCTKAFLKLFLLILNTILLLGSLVVIALTCFYIILFNDVTKEIEVNSTGPLIFSLVVGLTVFLISFLGFFGSLKENKCLLILYAVTLFTLLLLQIGACIYAFLEIDEEEAIKIIRDSFEKLVEDYPDNSSAKEFVDLVQKELTCCGTFGPADWNGQIPPSCCKTEVDVCKIADAYVEGCMDAIYDFLADSLVIIGAISILLCGLELIPGLMALWLRSAILF